MAVASFELLPLTRFSRPPKIAEVFTELGGITYNDQVAHVRKHYIK